MSAVTVPGMISRNTVAEIKGREHPEQVNSFGNINDYIQIYYRFYEQRMHRCDWAKGPTCLLLKNISRRKNKPKIQVDKELTGAISFNAYATNTKSSHDHQLL